MCKALVSPTASGMEYGVAGGGMIPEEQLEMPGGAHLNPRLGSTPGTPHTPTLAIGSSQQMLHASEKNLIEATAGNNNNATTAIR